MADLDIPELKCDQLGKGVRGKYLQHFVQGSSVVVVQHEIQKAFPTSEAVNKALASMLAFAHETQVRSASTPPRTSAWQLHERNRDTHTGRDSPQPLIPPPHPHPSRHHTQPRKPISQHRKVLRPDAHGGKHGDGLGGFGQAT